MQIAVNVVSMASIVGLVLAGCGGQQGGTGGGTTGETASSGAQSASSTSSAGPSTTSSAGPTTTSSSGASSSSSSGATSTSSSTSTSGSSSSSSGMTGTCSSVFVSSKASGMLAGEYQSWKTAHVTDCPTTNSAVVVKDGSVVSEGIGYGMLLAATNADQALFDKLWKFYTDHLDPNGLMNWQMGVCDAPGNNNANSATDGDLDAAMGLAIANARWGSNYKSQAVGLIGKIKQFETDSCMGLNVLRPGDKFGGCSDQYNMGKVNPSYFAPGYYRKFADLDTANAAFWKKLADDSYTLLANYQSQMGGLVPDWANVNGTVQGNYSYDACRTPWRVAVDYLWYCTPAAKTFLDGVSKYVDGHGGVANVPFDKNSAFLGSFALSGMAESQTTLDGYVSSWLSANVDDKPYFQGTLRVLYLGTAAGTLTP